MGSRSAKLGFPWPFKWRIDYLIPGRFEWKCTIVYSIVDSGADQRKQTLKLRVTGLCEGNSPVTGEFPAQMASNVENVSIWWRHHGDVTVVYTVYLQVSTHLTWSADTTYSLAKPRRPCSCYLTMPRQNHTRSIFDERESAHISDTDSKVHGANMGSTWGRKEPGGPHVGSMGDTYIVECDIVYKMFHFDASDNKHNDFIWNITVNHLNVY